MSIKKIALTSILGLMIAMVVSFAMQTKQKSPFAKHSVISSEQQHMGPWLPGKPNAPIRIHLYSPRGMAHYGTETTTIQALVQLTRGMNRPVSYHWVLPDGVQVVDGNLLGSVPADQVGRIFKTSITVTGLGIKELPRNVNLEVSTEIDGRPIGATGTYASHPMQPDGTFRARKERETGTSSWFSNKATSAASEEDSLESNPPPKGIHF